MWKSAMKVIPNEANSFLRKEIGIFQKQFYSESTGDQKVSYEEVKNISANKPSGTYLIDVREPEELKQTGYIPGSINIPVGLVQRELTSLDDKAFFSKYGLKKPKLESDIIFTCRSGRRAGNVMNEVKKLGYTRLKYYPGSWIEWESKRK